MTAADIEAVAELRVRAWQSAYAGLLPAAYLSSMSVEEDAAARRRMFAASDGTIVNLVAEAEDGGIAGWAALGPYRIEGPHGRGGPAGGAELYALYVRPDVLGTGVGRLLAGACLARAAASGASRIALWVIGGNARARRFYERAGFTLDTSEDAESLDDVAGTPVTVVRCTRPLLTGAV